MKTKAVLTVVIGALILVSFAIPVISGMNFYSTAENTTQGSTYSVYDGETIEASFDENGLMFDGKRYSSSVVFISSLLMITISQVYLYEAESVIDWASGDTLTIADGNFTGTGSFASVSGSVGADGVYADPDGDYGSFLSSDIYIDANSTYYLAFTNQPSFFAKGSYLDGVEVIRSVTASTSSMVDAPVESVNVDFTPTGEYTKLLSSPTITYNGSTKNVFCFAPLEYTVIGDGGSVGTLVDVIPLMLVVGLLVSSVALFILRRD